MSRQSILEVKQGEMGIRKQNNRYFNKTILILKNSLNDKRNMYSSPVDSAQHIINRKKQAFVKFSQISQHGYRFYILGCQMLVAKGDTPLSLCLIGCGCGHVNSLTDEKAGFHPWTKKWPTWNFGYVTKSRNAPGSGHGTENDERVSRKAILTNVNYYRHRPRRSGFPFRR